MKHIILVGDGMGDDPLDELGGRTPLEAAATPAMDRLARAGRGLLVRTVPQGLPPGSDVANLALMGYDPRRYYSGRGPLEAASMGVEADADETVFRCNLVCLDREGDRVRMIDYSAGHIPTADSRPLVEALAEALNSDRARFFPGIQYRHLLLLRHAPDLDTVPPHDHIGQDVTEHYQAYAAAGLGALMERAEEILAAHPVNQARRERGDLPANAIWPWGQGRALAMPTLEERTGLTGGLVSAVDLLKGIGVRAGLETPAVEGATGYIDTNYPGKVDAALDILARHDFVLVHVEAPDESAHNGRLDHKLKAIEDFDARIVAPMVQAMEERGEAFRLVLAMDHYTPLGLRTHIGRPVPLILFDSTSPQDGPARYTEAGVTAWCGGDVVDGPEFFKMFTG